jgi:hypothetical protein
MGKFYYIYYLHKGDDIPFYVGKTNNPITRISKHKKTYGTNIVLEIIEKTTTEDWRYLEELYIQLFRSWGFKLTNGFKGGGGASYWTEEQKLNPERIKKLSKPKPEGFGVKIKNNRNHKKAGIKAGKINTLKGHYDKGSKRNEKISNALKGRKVTWTGDSIYQYDLEGNFIKEWPSIRQAGLELANTNGEPIRKCCKKQQKTAYGFIWEYKI